MNPSPESPREQPEHGPHHGHERPHALLWHPVPPFQHPAPLPPPNRPLPWQHGQPVLQLAGWHRQPCWHLPVGSDAASLPARACPSFPRAHHLRSGSSTAPGGTWHPPLPPCPASAPQSSAGEGDWGARDPAGGNQPGHPHSSSPFLCTGSAPWDTLRDHALSKQDKSTIIFTVAPATQPPAASPGAAARPWPHSGAAASARKTSPQSK